MTDAATEERVKLAEAFLEEAVYRSREAQSESDPFEAGPDATCGLGAKAVVALELSPRGAEIFDELWRDVLSGEALAALRKVMTEWIRRQDTLDRKRNHFLKDFRREHGFDRTLYTDEQSSAYRSGLDAINAEVDATRRAAAQSLLKSA